MTENFVEAFKFTIMAHHDRNGKSWEETNRPPHSQFCWQKKNGKKIPLPLCSVWNHLEQSRNFYRLASTWTFDWQWSLLPWPHLHHLQHVFWAFLVEVLSYYKFSGKLHWIHVLHSFALSLKEINHPKSSQIHSKKYRIGATPEKVQVAMIAKEILKRALIAGKTERNWSNTRWEMFLENYK